MKVLYPLLLCVCCLAGCADDHAPDRGRSKRPDLKDSATGSGGAMEPEKEQAGSAHTATGSEKDAKDGTKENYNDEK